MRSTQSPIGTISPLSSATSMNSTGRDQPRGRVVPPHQRLEADGLAGRQLDDRLVVQLERAVLDRLVELGAHLQPLEHRGVQRRLVAPPPALAVALGHVEREVGLAQQVLRVAGLGRGGDADAGIAADQRRRRRRNGSPSAATIRVGDLLDLGRVVDVLDQRRELVAAEPGGACRAAAAPR